jgi:hypothetical protein
MRSAEGRKNIERSFIRQIDDREPGAPLVPVAVKDIVMPEGKVEEVPGSDARRVVVVVFRARRRHLPRVDSNCEPGQESGNGIPFGFAGLGGAGCALPQKRPAWNS